MTQMFEMTLRGETKGVLNFESFVYFFHLPFPSYFKKERFNSFRVNWKKDPSTDSILHIIGGINDPRAKLIEIPSR